VTFTETDFREHAARRFERRTRRWARPGDLALALDPATRDSAALRLIDAELAALADHRVPADALAIFCPPQEGKPVIISAMVLMSDGTRKQLGQIQVGDAVISHRGIPQVVMAVHDQGNLPIVKITTHAGRVIRAAADHPFLTPDGWVEAGKLTAGTGAGQGHTRVDGDVLAILRAPSTAYGDSLTAEAARLLGYLVGDGNTTQSAANLNAAITCADPIETADILRCAAALGFTAECHERDRRILLSAGARPWIRQHGLAGLTSHTKRVPAAVFTASPEVVAEFLGAYFACDGSVSRRGGARTDARLEFDSVSRDLLADVQHLLLRLGIGSMLRPKRTTYKGQPHLSWRLWLRRQDDVARFRQQVPMTSVKADVLAAWDLHRTEFDAPYLADPVMAVEREDPEPCRCLTVAEDHTFTVEDAVVHNSQKVSRRFPEWLLAHDPSLRIAEVSYEAEMATRWGRQIKRDIAHADRHVLDVQIMADSSAAGRWDTPEGGGLYCTGIGGALTGRPVDVLIIDDPVKGREEAESPVFRERAWDWWESTAIERMAPGGIVVLMMCIVAHMRVLTGDGRWTPVEDIRPGDTVVSLDEARTGLRTAKVTAARLSGTDDTLRVETDRLALEVNGRHPFAVLRSARRRPHASDVQWVTAAELRPGDIVVTSKCLPDDYAPADVLPDGSAVDEERAWLLGYLTGDGWVTMYARVNQARLDGGYPVSYGVCCAQTKSDKPWKTGLDERVLAALGAWSPNKINDSGRGYWRTDWNEGGKLLDAMGYRAGANAKRIPDCVWGWSPALRRAYLTGYCEADGGLQHDSERGPCWRVVSASKALLDDARDLALTCGIRPTTVFTQKPRTYQPPNSPQPIVAVSHTLGLTFMPDIAEGTGALSQTTGHPDPRHLRYEKIRAITPGPPQPVYDLTVEGSESFIAEGFAVHNTRWHTDDLAGRILTRPSPLRWRVLTMPAIAGPRDVLGRAPGEEFPSVRGRAPGHFRNLQATLGAYTFSSVYQQSPVAAAGNFFRKQAFRYWRPVDGVDPSYRMRGGPLAGAWIDCEGQRFDLLDCWRFATVDVAASTRTSADWTVVSVWAITRGGDLILMDRARGHVEMGDHFAMAKPLRSKWKFDVLFVERQFYSKTLVNDARQAGVPVAEVDADTDKVTRAIPAAGRLHAGKVWFPDYKTAPWVETEWEPELLSFDKGEHDDQVDTFSYAARVASAHWLPPPPPKRSRPQAGSPDMRQIEKAYAAGTGNGHDGPQDIMTMPLG
jgi:predicted phage terminase large subunit-like protein